MATRLQPVRGMRDLMPATQALHKMILSEASRVTALYDFHEVSTPLLEYREVFDRTVETSDIVAKEMYTVLSRSQEKDAPMVLRPEGTAPVMRALLSEALTQDLPLKFFYAGPMFRYDRPQKGRLRQFHQVGVEELGVPEPWADIEILACAYQFLQALHLDQMVNLEINTLGDRESYNVFRQKLTTYLEPYTQELSHDSQVRLKKNPLRILDSKEAHDQKIVEKAPSLSSCLTPEAQAFFEKVLEGLDALKIPYRLNPRLVRGLDYYTHTTFEWTTQSLGAQGTLLAGGRYDGLSPLLGGPEIPGVGWAAGVERLALLTSLRPPVRSCPVLIPQSEADLLPAMILAETLRNQGVPLKLMGGPQGIGKKIQKAQKAGHTLVLILGEQERTTQSITLKDLTKGHQETINQIEIGPFLKKILKTDKI